MFDRPVREFFVVPALVTGVEVRIWDIVSLNPVVCIAHVFYQDACGNLRTCPGTEYLRVRSSRPMMICEVNLDNGVGEGFPFLP